MDVKACDVCKKTNLEAELYNFFEYKMDYGKTPRADAPIAGFALRKLIQPGSLDAEMGMGLRGELVCKPCGEKKILADIAIL